MLSGPGGAEGKWTLHFRWLLVEFAGVQGRLHHAIHVHEDREYRRAWESTGVEVGSVLGLVLHRLRGIPVSADWGHHPADPHTLDCKSFS